MSERVVIDLKSLLEDARIFSPSGRHILAIMYLALMHLLQRAHEQSQSQWYTAKCARAVPVAT